MFGVMIVHIAVLQRVTDAGHCQVMVSMDGSGDIKFGSYGLL